MQGTRVRFSSHRFSPLLYYTLIECWSSEEIFLRTYRNNTYKQDSENCYCVFSFTFSVLHIYITYFISCNSSPLPQIKTKPNQRTCQSYWGGGGIHLFRFIFLYFLSIFESTYNFKMACISLILRIQFKAK